MVSMESRWVVGYFFFSFWYHRVSFDAPGSLNFSQESKYIFVAVTNCTRLQSLLVGKIPSHRIELDFLNLVWKTRRHVPMV